MGGCIDGIKNRREVILALLRDTVTGLNPRDSLALTSSMVLILAMYCLASSTALASFGSSFFHFSIIDSRYISLAWTDIMYRFLALEKESAHLRRAAMSRQRGAKRRVINKITTSGAACKPPLRVSQALT